MISQSGRPVRIPSPVDFEASDSELDTAPSAGGKRKATATKSFSGMVHEAGTVGLPESTDSDSEEEEDDDDDDDEEATQDSLLQQDEESEMDSEDDFEEGADGGSSAKVSKKSKKMDAKSSLSTVSTISRKRGDWQLVARFDNTGSHKKAMKKVKQCFKEQMCLAGAREMKTSDDFKTLGGWRRNKVFISDCFKTYFFQPACWCH